MVPELRKKFNETFTEEKYNDYIDDLSSVYPGHLVFRVAETPIFCDKSFSNKILSVCENIIDTILTPEYMEKSNRSIPENLQVPNETGHSQFIAFDFGICENASGELEPQLIELQGFPTLFAYQVLHNKTTRKHFDIPENYSCFFSGLNEESYIELLKEIIIGGHNPENVILLEVLPEEQKTRIDFYCTKEYLGINIVCLTNLVKKGNQLYYLNNGKETLVKRIYNRLIFDDLQQQPAEIQEKGKILFEDLDVEWIPHPNWFYRISKFTMPFINHPYVPETRFLNEIDTFPSDLENYVLKPLFSFAGQGVVIDVHQDDIDNIKDPENWILQRKVKYAEVIPTPDVPAKAEIRIFYFWKDGDKRPIPTNNLARLSKGKMIGVRYNFDKTWVGGSLVYFEQ